MYYSGDGIPRNAHEAARWFLVAVNQYDATAQHNLGVLYYRGEGVPLDLDAAARVRLAASQGLPSAETDLAWLYETGSGVSRDYFTAYLWYSRAIAAGDSSGASHRDTIAHHLTRKQRDEGTAIASASSSPRVPLDPSPANSLSVLPTH